MLKIPTPAAERLLDYSCIKLNGVKIKRQFHDDLEARAFGRATWWVRTIHRCSPKTRSLGPVIYRYVWTDENTKKKSRR